MSCPECGPLLKRLHAAERLLVIVSNDWWPYVHDSCTIDSVKRVQKRITAYFKRKVECIGCHHEVAVEDLEDNGLCAVCCGAEDVIR